ncbi:MAG: 2TM domain-containing protein [Saprospiraceae bacterium]
MKTNDPYEKARKRVKAKKEFYQHFNSYVSVGAFLLVLNIVTSFGDWWFMYPMMGWGIGLAIHFMSVFGIPGMEHGAEDWEERAIQKEMEKMKRKGEFPPSEEPEESLELKEIIKEKHGKNWDEKDLV